MCEAQKCEHWTILVVSQHKTRESYKFCPQSGFALCQPQKYESWKVIALWPRKNVILWNVNSNVDLHCVKHKIVIPKNWSHFDSIKKMNLWIMRPKLICSVSITKMWILKSGRVLTAQKKNVFIDVALPPTWTCTVSNTKMWILKITRTLTTQKC